MSVRSMRISAGLVAVRGTAHVDDAGIGGVDGDGDVVIALRELVPTR